MGLFKKETEEELKLKELVGGFLLSNNFMDILKTKNLSNRDGIDMQRLLKLEIKQGKLRVDDIEPRLEYLLDHPDEARNVQELVNQEREREQKLKKQKREQKQKLEEEEKERKRKLKEEEKERIQKLPKEERDREMFKEDVRKGGKCKILKPVIGNNGHDGLTKGVATAAFGIVGWALTSGSKTKAQTVEVDATIKVVPKGVVILSEYEETMRIPFDQILNANIKSGWIYKNFDINVVGDKKITIRDCQFGEAIVSFINKYATGVEDEGWV